MALLAFAGTTARAHGSAAPPLDVAVVADAGAAAGRSAGGPRWTDAAWAIAAAAALAFLLRRGRLSLADAPPRPPLHPHPGVTFALATAAMLLAPFAARAIAAGIDADPLRPTVATLALLSLGAALAQAPVVGAFLFLAARGVRLIPDRRPPPARALWTGFLALALLVPLVQAASIAARGIVALLGGPPSDAIAHQTLALMSGAAVDGWWVCLALLVTLAVPLIEEVIYRGLLQQGLIQVGLSRWPAILLVSGFFALRHVGAVEPDAIPALAALSVGFGWVYERTGRLAAPVLMHALFNMGNLGLALALHPG